VFENRMLRRTFGPKRDEIIGGWRKLHNEEHHSLYCSPNVIRMIKSRKMKWAEHVARMGIRKMHIGFWWENPEGKTPVGRRTRRWEDNIKMDLREI
jgi:hypothetical protein